MGFWSGRPVLVTGSTGLLGGWLVSRLVAEGAEVTVLARRRPEHLTWWERVTPVAGDIRDEDLMDRTLRQRGIDTVFHLAAQAIVGEANARPTGTFEINIKGSWQLLEAARLGGSVKQFIYASTDKAYGEHPDLPYLEETPLRGRYPYEASKACADLIAQSYAATYNMRVAITRCANFYGGGDLNWNRIVPGTIRAALSGERPLIRSDGQFIRDYLYIEDAVEAYVTLAEALASRGELTGQAFNFGHNVPVTVLDLVQRILNLCGRSDLCPDVRGEASREIRAQYLDASKAQRLLGWTPNFSLTEGLLRTIAWYRAHLEARGASGEMAGPRLAAAGTR
jgi:CDP-glucose 4,6-dehydratase